MDGVAANTRRVRLLPLVDAIKAAPSLILDDELEITGGGLIRAGESRDSYALQSAALVFVLSIAQPVRTTRTPNKDDLDE